MIRMENLEICFNKAIASKSRYVAVAIQMEGFPYDEIIINHIENAEGKLEYYKKVYNDDLTHKFSNGIRIVGYTYGNNLGDIEWDFCM